MTQNTEYGSEPAAWLVRGGGEGEGGKAALGGGLIIVGWEGLGGLGGCGTREGVRQALNVAYPQVAANVIANWTGQLWRGREQISAGDLVVMPLKTKPGQVAIGQVTGPYEYRAQEPEGFRHVRPVKWLRTDIPREVFRPDLRASITS